MSPIGDILPTAESHVRPLLKLSKPADRVEAWKEVVENAEGKPITAKMVETVASRRYQEIQSKKRFKDLNEFFFGQGFNVG